jgi:hypothetical protein
MRNPPIYQVACLLATCFFLPGCSADKSPTDVQNVEKGTPDSGDLSSVSVKVSLSDGTVNGCVEAPPGLLAWWTGDGNALDITGAFSGVLRGSATFGPGVVGRAFLFDTDPSYVDIPMREAMNLGRGAGKEWTLDFWYMATDDGGPPDRELVVKRVGLTSYQTDYRIFLERDYPEPAIIWGTGGVEDPCAWMAAPEPALNAWHHVAGVLRSTGDQTGKKAFYIDGALVGECTYRLKADKVSAPLRLGRGADRQFYGMIDEIEIFDRALSDEEIFSIYNAGSAGKCKFVFADIDILPPNINPGSNRIIHVAVLTTPVFEAASLDPETVTLGPGQAVPVDKERIQDVDADGDLDVVLSFRIQDTGIADGDTEVCLTGLTRDGAEFRGCAPIFTVASTEGSTE